MELLRGLVLTKGTLVTKWGCMHGMHLCEFLRTFQRKFVLGVASFGRQSQTPPLHVFSRPEGLGNEERKNPSSAMDTRRPAEKAGQASHPAGWEEPCGLRTQALRSGRTSSCGRALAGRRIRNPEQVRASG